MVDQVRGRLVRAAVVVGLMGVGFAGGWVLHGAPFARDASGTERQAHRLGRLTSPFLECVGQINADRGLVRVRTAVLRYIRQAQQRDPSLRVSVYARDLNNGPWIGIDEQAAEYTPASLWKVPLMLYILTLSEGDPDLLDREILFPGPEHMKREDTVVGAPGEVRMQPGRRYAVRELLFRMIANSDNHAEELLLTGIGKADVDRLLYAINASDSYVSGEPMINARTYASLFRVLYNATLVSRPRSEFALGLLTRSYFRNGLRRHIPEDVEVASKFGLYVRPGSGARETQLHECGIVYHPRSPYILCVLTKSASASPDRLSDVLATVSRLVWEGKQPDRP